MKIYKLSGQRVVIEKDDSFFLFNCMDWDGFINRDNLYHEVLKELGGFEKFGSFVWEKSDIEAPVKNQEIWASGVTYLRSREARMEEAKDSGGADLYSKVYDAERPELFFKSTAARCVGTGGTVNIRKDATWNVPEPELTLFANTNGNIVGYTIGNDMSSRDIEGENPLYLPQAKCYDNAAAIGPCLYVTENPIDSNTKINMVIYRDSKDMFSGQIGINQMKRTHQELIEYLFRELSFPYGVYLMTGTCLVPTNEFTLAVEDEIHITIDGIGTLINKVGIKNN